MIPQNNYIIQAIDEKILSEIPIAQTASGGKIYILIKDLPEETAKYIQGEKLEEVEPELPVLPEGYEEIVVAGWRSRGFKCTYCRQRMEYMKQDAIIRYPHVKNPETGVSIFLIPWFMVPKKKYPVQVYAYAAWYKTITEEPAGVIETAEVVKELFGLETFDPSTVCRTKAQMSRIFRGHNENGCALSNQEPETASTAEIIDWVTEALGKQPADESTKHADGKEIIRFDTQTMPAAAEADGQAGETQRYAEKAADSGDNEDKADIAAGERAVCRADDDLVIARVLGNIPRALAQVKKPKSLVKHEHRGRAPRERGERLPSKHKEIDFIERRQLEMKRDEFTRNCRNIVLNAALIYHKLLN